MFRKLENRALHGGLNAYDWLKNALASSSLFRGHFPSVEAVATILLRIALALAFLSAVADRFGLWGKPGSPGVSWGNMTQFNAYVARLN